MPGTYMYRLAVTLAVAVSSCEGGSSSPDSAGNDAPSPDASAPTGEDSGGPSTPTPATTDAGDLRPSDGLDTDATFTDSSPDATSNHPAASAIRGHKSGTRLRSFYMLTDSGEKRHWSWYDTQLETLCSLERVEKSSSWLYPPGKRMICAPQHAIADRCHSQYFSDPECKNLIRVIYAVPNLYPWSFVELMNPSSEDDSACDDVPSGFYKIHSPPEKLSSAPYHLESGECVKDELRQHDYTVTLGQRYELSQFAGGVIAVE